MASRRPHPYVRRHINPILHAALQDLQFAHGRPSRPRPERPDHDDGWHEDFEARFQSLAANGLQVRTEVLLADDWLWMIRLHAKRPPSEWAPRFGAARIREGLTDWHITIVEKGLADAFIPDIVEKWHDRDLTVRFKPGHTTGGTLNLDGGIADDPNVIEAHRRSREYGHKPIHVSF